MVKSLLFCIECSDEEALDPETNPVFLRRIDEN